MNQTFRPCLRSSATIAHQANVIAQIRVLSRVLLESLRKELLAGQEPTNLRWSPRVVGPEGSYLSIMRELEGIGRKIGTVVSESPLYPILSLRRS